MNLDLYLYYIIINRLLILFLFSPYNNSKTLKYKNLNIIIFILWILAYNINNKIINNN